MNNNTEQKKPATLDDVVDALQRNQEVLEDIATWVKIGNFDNIKKILEATLKTPEEKLVYHLSNNRTTREINSACGVSIGTISKQWNAWYKIGLMKTVSVSRGDRFIKKFNLEDFGIDVPIITPKKEQESKASPPEQPELAEANTPGETT